MASLGSVRTRMLLLDISQRQRRLLQAAPEPNVNSRPSLPRLIPCRHPSSQLHYRSRHCDNGLWHWCGSSSRSRLDTLGALASGCLQGQAGVAAASSSADATVASLVCVKLDSRSTEDTGPCRAQFGSRFGTT